MHGGVAAFAYTDLNVVEDQASVLRVDLDLDDLAVAYASLFGLSGADVQVTFCNDDAFSNLYLTGRADQLAGSAALQVAGQSDRSVQAEASGIGGGKLYLGLGAEWAKDADIWLALLRANDGDLLVAGKLAFDGQFFLNGQLCVWAKQGGKSSAVRCTCLAEVSTGNV